MSKQMKKSRVAVTAPSFVKSSELMAELAALDVEIIANPTGLILEGSSLIEFLQNAQAPSVIIGRELITDEVLAACPHIKLVAKYGVGLDNVDEEAMKRRGVQLGWTAGVNKRSVAELVLAFALGHCRNVIPSLCAMREGRWEKDGGRELSSLTVGIVGFGHTGSEVAKLLTGFGCKVLYADIVDKTDLARKLGAESASYEEILARADVITFHVPGTPVTNGMFGREQIGKVKRDVLVINAARGTVVDFDATCEAVKSGKMGGFAADVFAVEPCDLSKWVHPRLYFTPHIGGNSVEAVRGMGRAAIEWVGRGLES